MLATEVTENTEKSLIPLCALCVLCGCSPIPQTDGVLSGPTSLGYNPPFNSRRNLHSQYLIPRPSRSSPCNFTSLGKEDKYTYDAPSITDRSAFVVVGFAGLSDQWTGNAVTKTRRRAKTGRLFGFDHVPLINKRARSLEGDGERRQSLRRRPAPAAPHVT